MVVQTSPLALIVSVTVTTGGVGVETTSEVVETAAVVDEDSLALAAAWNAS